MTANDKYKVFLDKADILVQALPFMQRYQGQTIVIKFGGNAMIDDTLFTSFARDVILLKQVGINPVIVHGGGPQINEMLNKLNIQSNFVDGLRVTDKATIDVVSMVLTQINKRIISEIIQLGGQAVGLSGIDGGLLRAKPTDAKLGFVGTPCDINKNLLAQIQKDSDIIPVIVPIALGRDDNQFYNVNADTAAGYIAAGIGARRLLLLTDIAGIMDKNGTLIEELNIAEARKLIKSDVITGGMIPKLETCIDALEQGLRAAAILDGRFAHSILLELFTEHGHGTLLRS